MKISIIIAAAGSGQRMGGKSKALLSINGRPALEYSLRLFSRTDAVIEILIAAREADMAALRPVCLPFAKARLVIGGETRQDSVTFALLEVSPESSHVAVHDAARPLLHQEDWQNLMEQMALFDAAILAASPVDSVKMLRDGLVEKSLPRQAVVLAGTPQLFRAEVLRRAYAEAKEKELAVTDDAALVEAMGVDIAVVMARHENFKLTYPEDKIRAEQIIAAREGGVFMDLRCGIGWDSHRLSAGRPLVLGGMEIPFGKGLLGHSDADVLLHAVIDALLGAAALGDIGQHFPDTDETYRGISSLDLLRRTAHLLAEAGFAVGNLDATLIAEQPKLMPYLPQMAAKIEATLQLPKGTVSVKAKTAEGMDSVGRGEAIQAQAVALLSRREPEK